jgi:hypothetical protein
MPRHLIHSCALLPLSLLCADELSIGDKGKFTGTIKSITPEQQIYLQSPNSPELLLLNGDALTSLRFESQQAPRVETHNIINLKNGDVIHADVNSLDAEKLTFRTPWANQLAIERSAIDSLHFGTGKNKVLYSGPKKDEWDLSRSWTFDDALVSQGWNATHRKFDSFPDRYILQFTVEWEGNVGFKCLFNSNSVDSASNSDCYYMQLNSAGFELKRISPSAKKFTTLVAFNELNAENLSDNKIRIEVRVDRTNRQMQLLINDEVKRNNIIDPMETGPSPTGTIISFSATAGNDDTQKISEINLTSWASNSAEARMERRTETKRDVLFDVESNRFSGTLKSILPGKAPQVLFENPHDPKPKPMPADKVAVIYFAGQAAAKPESTYSLRLTGGGLLHVNSFTFADDKVRALHPSLGELSIPASNIELITRIP